MKSSFIFLLFLTIGLSTAGRADQIVQSLAPQQGDISATLLTKTEQMQSINKERAFVQYTQPLHKDSILAASQTPQIQSSRQYWLDASARELHNGLELSTTAINSIIRLSPRSPEQQVIDLSAADIIFGQQGHSHRAGSNISTLADTQQLNAAGATFSPGTIAFRAAAESGFGEMQLQIPSLPKGDYIVHVFEPESEVLLNLQTRAHAYLAGTRFNATISLSGIRHALNQRDIQAFITSPDATQSYPVQLVPDSNNRISIQATLPLINDFNDGLWTLNAILSTSINGLRIHRDVKTAFNLTVPTARILGIRPGDSNQHSSLKKKASTSTTNLDIGLETAVAGRYEISGILYGTNPQGQLQAIAMHQAAGWFEPGRHTLPLNFPHDVTAQSGLSAPFELRNLTLKDQSRIGLLHQQARAVLIQ